MTREDKEFFFIKPEIVKTSISTEEVYESENEVISDITIYYIYCEGNAEKSFFDTLKMCYFNSSRIKVNLYKPNLQTEGNNAKKLINQIIDLKKKIKKEYEKEEEVFLDNENLFYLIFDRDRNHIEPNIDNNNLNYCFIESRKNNINTIFSNPCFEVWKICQHLKPNVVNFPKESEDVKNLYSQIRNRRKKFSDCVKDGIKNSKDLYFEVIKTEVERDNPEKYPFTEIWKIIIILENKLK